MTTLDTLSPAALQILAKEVAKAKADTRDALTIGDTDVDEITTLHITGTTRCGEDYVQDIVAKADPWGLLEAALDMLAGHCLDALVTTALTTTPKSRKATKARCEAAVRKVKGPTATDCKGKVTLPVKAVAVIDTMAAEAAAIEDAAETTAA